MPDPLPRIGLVLLAPALAGGDRRGVAAFERARREAPVDLVLVERAPRVGIGVGADVEQVRAAGVLRDALARARERAAPGCALVTDVDPRDLLRQGALDALLLVGPPPGATPRLRVRPGARVLEPAPGDDRPRLAERLDPDAVARALTEGVRALRALGVRRPRLVALETDGDARERGRLEAALAAARAAGAPVTGPVAPLEAAPERADAFVAAAGGQADLLLALLGQGPVTTLLLGPDDAGLRVAVAEPDGLRAALDLLAAWSRAEGDLVAARAPTVSITRAGPAPASRCPFCRRALDESPAGELVAPGPPLVCEGCGTAHHRDCLAEHGRCTLLGCDARRARRLGVLVPIAGLGPEAPARHPFRALEGDAGQAATTLLRVEAPIDDPAACDRRRIELELGAAATRRGDLVEGFVVLAAPRPLRVRGGLLRLRATLTTRDHADPSTPPRVHTIVDREAPLVGDAPASALGRLHDGVASLLGGMASGVAIPAGRRRWPFSFRLPADHPASVKNRRGSQEEVVETTLEVVVDTDRATRSLAVL
ncbi:MAG: hypothetical protein M9894_15885 [Planctomycetes bacterium]|nr:hypothetical protein [Planctomycetota bacterium]